MKSFLAAALVLTSISSSFASDILLSESIKTDLRNKIHRDLNIIENFKFGSVANPATLKVMGLATLDAQTATNWLNKRVSYIVSENALSIFNLLVKRVIFVERKGVDFPNAAIIPYSQQASDIQNGFGSEAGFTVMSNVGSALYYAGKKEKQVYGLKISKGLLHSAEKVAITSPRSGIIQIGEGLFVADLTVNKENPDALANSIFRLGTFFHEARHSDGNGLSLGFMHINCPAGHDYAGQPACDESLNGPYMVGTLMMAEMAKACEDKCSEKDKQTLKLLVLDSANRVLPTTHKGETATDWDANPESL
jgi:hypothetical protein